MSNTEDRIVIPAEHISDQYDLREYAAIKLRIPDSGIDWLDEMIVKAERRNIAAKAMQGLLANSDVDIHAKEDIAILSYEHADAIIKKWYKKE